MKFGSTDVRLRQEKRKAKKKEKKLKKIETKLSLKEGEEKSSDPDPQVEATMLTNFEECFDDDFDYKRIEKTAVDEGIVIDYMTFAQ